ncbi:MAG: bacteriocin biosynthesis protein, partial [Candidatus Korarchaeota archaeon]
RYLLIEVGEVLQNIRLVATAVGLRTASTSAFVDDFINQSLNGDYPHFAVMSIVGLGAQS